MAMPFVPYFKTGDRGTLLERSFHHRDDLGISASIIYEFIGTAPGADTLFYRFKSVNGGYPYTETEVDFEVGDVVFNTTGSMALVPKNKPRKHHKNAA